MRQLNEPEELYLNAELTPTKVRDVQRRVKAGELFRIAPGIATPVAENEWPTVIWNHRIRVLAAMCPGAVLGYKTAFHWKRGDTIYLAYSYDGTIVLPGQKIVLKRSMKAIAGDSPMGNRNIFFPSEARMFLDNMTRTTDRDRNVARSELEARLAATLDARGAQALQDLRTKIERVGAEMQRPNEAAALGKIIGAILGTRPDVQLQNGTAKAAALGTDAARLGLFTGMVAQLKHWPAKEIADVTRTPQERFNFAFLESYFSNFIEGTEFEIQEAHQIVSTGQIIQMRPKDSHDILGVFAIANSPLLRAAPLASGEDGLAQLKARHLQMMNERPDVQPGEFKVLGNQFGNVSFVAPRNVRGTLMEGLARLNEVSPGLPRALLTMFVVSEVHPFVDGNGRISRLMMNAELSAASQCRIIVPTLMREEYLDCLRLLTREGDAAPFLKVMSRLQQWTSMFAYENSDDLIASVRATNALERSRLDFKLLDPAGPKPTQAAAATARPGF